MGPIYSGDVQTTSGAVISSIPLHLPDSIQQQHLPKLPDQITSDELLLEPRTRNCLIKRGLLDPPQKLADLTSANRMQTPAVKKCFANPL